MMRVSPRSASASKTSSSSPTEATRRYRPSGRRSCASACCATSVSKPPGLPLMQMQTLESVIEDAFERRADLTQSEIESGLRDTVDQVLNLLESGERRVAEPDGKGGWVTHAWLKKAVLLYFRMNGNRVMDGGPSSAFDKVPLRFTDGDATEYANLGARVVPGALVRRGAHIAKDAVLMPSYTNIGAYVGAGTMVDTWATVGSCAQIGAGVHLSGGVGIGGVLEPLQANPTIIEDNCFIGARSEVVEGVIVEKGSVIGMGVFLGQSTRIYNRATGEISYGRVPAGSVVVAGSLPAKDGSHSLYAAIIVKQVDEKTRSKTGINELLRSGD
ncbi:2,3,4,5-tetrahydropyridine-2,6-dicarboxylate N-succinyltransferase [Luteibacter aegosomatissinici]|uniref:2,3,4,5-tetrahydropyridine-2,6-dicarboxylate N-succinyltransferase n=1 Tax=Luteibacter aegosomatissinici TaxID=2911539 RepID=UPI001FF9BF8E|nr:2,3,4,5-tetrahydropyridine-2,6-dicarboxylate N-succinyltransferase [Luteibacter aegosomatissinici]UPG93534.1 2,3,4,5-tetrahydropyridine-2,6-dicarboxylate N-succinyltransferase [Luteibacter aegosomatissinici]